jgi:hypothetical protein
MAGNHPIDNTGYRFGMHFVDCHDKLRESAYDNVQTSTAR